MDNLPLLANIFFHCAVKFCINKTLTLSGSSANPPAAVPTGRRSGLRSISRPTAAPVLSLALELCKPCSDRRVPPAKRKFSLLQIAFGRINPQPTCIKKPKLQGPIGVHTEQKTWPAQRLATASRSRTNAQTKSLNSFGALSVRPHRQINPASPLPVQTHELTPVPTRAAQPPPGVTASQTPSLHFQFRRTSRTAPLANLPVSPVPANPPATSLARAAPFSVSAGLAGGGNLVHTPQPSFRQKSSVPPHHSMASRTKLPGRRTPRSLHNASTNARPSARLPPAVTVPNSNLFFSIVSYTSSTLASPGRLGGFPSDAYSQKPRNETFRCHNREWAPASFCAYRLNEPQTRSLSASCDCGPDTQGRRFPYPQLGSYEGTEQRHPTKPTVYKIFSPWGEKGISLRKGSRWNKEKKPKRTVEKGRKNRKGPGTGP